MKWLNAQRVEPKDMQMVLVIGEPKTTKNISCHVCIYSRHGRVFISTSMHKLAVPLEKARWWLPFTPPGTTHPMDQA